VPDLLPGGRPWRLFSRRCQYEMRDRQTVEKKARIVTTDEKLQDVDERIEELCAEFRRRMSRLLNEERILLGLAPSEDEIEIYY
jgi:hypothetical protein